MLFLRNYRKCRITGILRQLGHRCRRQMTYSESDVFSAVAFLRARVGSNEGTETQLDFVFGKPRVAPMKAQTILKLKLQAALLAARLKDEIVLALTLPVEHSCEPIVQLSFNGSIPLTTNPYSSPTELPKFLS